MGIRYKLISSKGVVIFNGLTADEAALVEQTQAASQQIKIGNATVRVGVANSTYGTVLGLTDDADYLKSSKKFQAALQSLSVTLKTLEEIVAECRKQINTNTSRLLHNLITLNAHNIQEVYSLVPQDVLTKVPASKQVQVVQHTVKSESKDTAIALLRIAKNNASMKTEFSVFNKLFDSNPRLEKKHHNVHKVLMNILYLFFPDFTDKDVLIKVGCPENTIAFFDYESIHVALYHLVENAVKYVRPHSEVAVDIFKDDASIVVQFDMCSLAINDHEIESIFEDGYSGVVSRETGKSGSGIGMCRVKDILEINHSEISVQTYPTTRLQYGDAPYQKNIFHIRLPT